MFGIEVATSKGNVAWFLLSMSGKCNQCTRLFSRLAFLSRGGIGIGIGIGDSDNQRTGTGDSTILDFSAHP